MRPIVFHSSRAAARGGGGSGGGGVGGGVARRSSLSSFLSSLGVGPREVVQSRWVKRQFLKHATHMVMVACAAYLVVGALEAAPRVYTSLTTTTTTRGGSGSVSGGGGGSGGTLSSSIDAGGLDIGRMLRSRPGCRVYTFYDPITEGGYAQKSREELPLLRVWKKTWRERGWDPVVLSTRDAERHPRFEEYRRRFASLPTGTNPPQYEMACFVRWLAMTHVG